MGNKNVFEKTNRREIGNNMEFDIGKNGKQYDIRKIIFQWETRKTREYRQNTIQQVYKKYNHKKDAKQYKILSFGKCRKQYL